MSEEDLEILITLDDPGEEDLRVDTFDHTKADNRIKRLNNDETSSD